MPVKMDGPIPGQSLTMEPGNAPWEQPSLYDKPEQALAFYMEKFEDEDIMDQTLFLLEQGMPLSALVESMTTMGVAEGIHTLDVSMLIAPIMHEYLLNLAQSANINVNEDDQPDEAERMKARDKQRLLILLGDMGPDEEEMPEGFSEIEEAEDVDFRAEEGPEEVSPPRGMINRRT